MEIAVLGAGAWGTAIACTLVARHDVRLYARDPAQAEAIAAARSNPRYLPGVSLPASLQITADLERALSGADLIVVATPTAALRAMLQAAARTAAVSPLVWLCKGFETHSHLLGHEIARTELSTAAFARCGPLAGPSFAEEVARGLPTALTVAGAPDFCSLITSVFHGGAIRIYSSPDVIGVEIGGAVKNVMAIATGIADALQLGHNARAALITRGLAEATRLGVARGALPETFMGLTGLGDLVLTATGDLSRNRRVGLALGRGLPLDEVLAELGHVAEGVASAHAVRECARRAEVEMPITEVVCAVLDGVLTPARALDRLLAREPKVEQPTS